MMRSLVAASTLIVVFAAGAGWAPAVVAGAAKAEPQATRTNVIPRQDSDWRRASNRQSPGNGNSRYRNDESHKIRGARKANGFREELEGGLNRDD